MVAEGLVGQAMGISGIIAHLRVCLKGIDALGLGAAGAMLDATICELEREEANRRGRSVGEIGADHDYSALDEMAYRMFSLKVA